MSKKISRVTEKELGIISKENVQSSHIPSLLIERVNGLEHLSFREILGHMATEYASCRFTDIEEEYVIIRNYILQIAGNIQGLDITPLVEKSMDNARAVPVIDKAIREQFIHPFQVFLLGSIIIDKYYESFLEWFYPDPNTADGSLEESWIFTSLFHDRMKTILSLLHRVESEIPLGVTKYPKQALYIQKMSSMFLQMSRGDSCLSWTDQPLGNEQLTQVLENHSQKQNHGVLSAMNLLYSVERGAPTLWNSGRMANIVNACLSMALHDKELRRDLTSGGIFPMDMANFPLECLLIYCDTIHEWSRDIEQGVDVKLTELRLEKNCVYCEVSFDNKTRASAKSDECFDTQSCFGTTPLKLDFGIRIHMA